MAGGSGGDALGSSGFMVCELALLSRFRRLLVRQRRLQQAMKADGRYAGST